MMSVDQRKENFVKAYILTGCKNGTQAAIDAGYSEKTAAQQASRLLKDVKVKALIDKFKVQDLKPFIKSKTEKLEMLQDIAIACMVIDGEKGMLNAPSAIAAIKEHNAMQGDNAPTETSNTHTIVKADDTVW
jgi:hypothetical protein